MRLFQVDNWLKTPADRDIIHRWTMGNARTPENAASHTLEFPESNVSSSESWRFLALGDTGDAAAYGPGVSPQDAVAQQLARDAAVPEFSGAGEFVLHTGDVIYMTGEKRLYDRNFRRPYAPFLTPESTVDDLVFQLPFLPVPGNHDYYDLGAWASWVGRIPMLGRGLRAAAHRLFAFSLPEGGSDMGRAYMEAFVDLARQGQDVATLPYTPGQQTRLPNRYYQYRYRNVDVFALDSNTLDAPPPGADAAQVRRDAADRATLLEVRARDIDNRLSRLQAERDRLRREQRDTTAANIAERSELAQKAVEVATFLAQLHLLLTQGSSGGAAEDGVAVVLRRWEEGASDLANARDTVEAAEALAVLDDASDDACAALRPLEKQLSELPLVDARRAEMMGLRDAVDKSLSDFSSRVSPTPPELEATLRDLAEQALDVQRELAMERRRRRYRPEDHDGAQFRWLDAALTRSERERPDAWRILFLHHPLYTTIGNHSERSDVVGLRENLLSTLAGRVHMVLSGHSHAFEWFRSDALPNTGLFVTGAGGQITLRPSLLEPGLWSRRRDRYESLRRAGVVECITAGVGPAAKDGEEGSLYSYLNIEVATDRILVRPVGVRRLRSGAFRREEPMPVFYTQEFPENKRPPFVSRSLPAIAVYRNRPAEPLWE